MIEKITAPPKGPAAALETVKENLHIASDYENKRLLGMIGAATTWVEGLTGKAMVEQTREVTVKPFPGQEFIELPTLPLLEILSISYRNTPLKGTTCEENRRITLPDKPLKGDITLRMRVGYGPSPGDIPPPLRQAILMGVTTFYESGKFPQESDVISLIHPYKSLSIL